MIIRSNRTQLEVNVSASAALLIGGIQESAEMYGHDLEDYSIFTTIDKDGATIILMNNDGFENCHSIVFGLDESRQWDMKECKGMIETMQALCPSISLIDKEDEDGVH